MDSRNFDRWTRNFASSSRRGAVRLLAAALASGPLLAGAGRAAGQTEAEACGKKGDRCRDNNDCCDRFRCRNDKCRDRKNSGGGNANTCGKDGDRCNRNGDCCNKLKCRNERCRGSSGGNNGNCGRQGDRCRDNSDCCNNFRCKNEKCRSRD